MALFSIINAEVMHDGRVIRAEFESNTFPSGYGVPDWYLGRINNKRFYLSIGNSGFSDATYTHSTRILSAADINLTLSSGYSVYVADHPNITGGVYAINGINTNEIVLSGNGLGGQANGATGISGAKQNQTRAWGFELNAVENGIHFTQATLCELNIIANMNTYQNTPYALLNGSISEQVKQFIIRNNTCYRSGPSNQAGSDLTKAISYRRLQNLIDNINTNLLCTNDTTNFSSWSHYSGSNNFYRSNSSTPHQVGSSPQTLSEYQSTTANENNSQNSGNISYANASVNLGNWYEYIGGSTGFIGLYNALYARPMNIWPNYTNTWDAIKYMQLQYTASGIFTPTSNFPLNYVGAGYGDPTESDIVYELSHIVNWSAWNKLIKIGRLQ